MDRSATTPLRPIVAGGLAIAADTAAVVHFGAAARHFTEYWAFGAFLLAAAWLQLAWAGAVVYRPSRPLLALGLALNASIVAVYAVTRTVGDVIGPTPGIAEPVGFADAFCTACEVLVVLGAALLLVRPLDRMISTAGARRALASTAALAVALVSASLAAGGPDMAMNMDSGASAAAGRTSISLATDSPAGPVTMPDPGGQMAAGMKMADAACTKTPTAVQQAAAVDLVNATWADNKKYQSLDAARAAGYRPVTPTGLPVVHYINTQSYLATIRGGAVLDPTAPQSLVYANTPAGAVLVAAMYIDSPRDTATPDPGGCLTQWHVHTNLCFGSGGKGVVGVSDPTCPAGSVNRVSPPMLHVWFVPIPGGPTAVDATDAQVVQAAERVNVNGPHNGSA